jgi:hypothetical protein
MRLYSEATILVHRADQYDGGAEIQNGGLSGDVHAIRLYG